MDEQVVRVTGPHERMSRDWNDTVRPYSRDVRIEAMIEAWAASQPERVVAVSESGELTFGRLDRLANKLAYHLQAVGAGPGDFVLVCLERDHAVLVAILAVLKAGAAFIPLDPQEPESRIARITELDHVSVVVTDAAFASSFEGMGLNAVLLELECLERAQISADRPSPAGAPTDPAYGIATSGSSGTPKMVAVAHRSVVNLIEWIGETFRIGPNDRGLWVSPASFDLSVFDLLGLPALGASVRMVPRERRRDPIVCAGLLRREPITFWNSTPALLQTLLPFLKTGGVPAGNEGLRLAFLSGDWLPLGLPDRLRSAFPGVQVVSLGGATEATVWSNYFPVAEIDPSWTSIPYGRPIQNARYYILGHGLEVCDAGVPGELYIAGDCLALGYLADAALTASRFLPDPFAGNGEERMYRTGDAARFWPDGTIELLGRLDNQINVRGYRIDLGEVEAALKRCGLLQAVAVGVNGVAGTQRIVAAGVPQAAGRNANGLRADLQRWLPAYMVPDAIRLMDALPLTGNGKVDRRAIVRLFEAAEPPVAALRATSGPAQAASLTPADIEAFLRAEIWALGGGSSSSIAGDRPLGEAGLGSLEFALLSGRLFEAFGLRVSPVEFYRGGTLPAVAAIVAEMSVAPVAPLAVAGMAPAETSGRDAGARAAVVGMSCRVPGAGNLTEFWEVLRSGRDCVRAMPEERARLEGGDTAGVRAGFLDDIDAFDARFFGITPREAEAMDPRQRILLEAVWTAIEHAGEDPAALAGSRTGVFIGATGDDFSRLAHRDPAAVAAHTLTGVAPSMLANRISFLLDLRGPSEVLDTACSSSLFALHRAVSAMAMGDCDAAIVGGVSLMLDRATHLSLERIGMLSGDGACKTFDGRADGYARGEGVAVVYLKCVEMARAGRNRIYGVVLGSAVNHSGRGVSVTSPSPEAQKRVIQEAHRRAGIDPKTVGMIEAHGTGTALGDPIETRALVDAFADLYRNHGLAGEADRHCALNAVKANIGHLEAAAGIAGLVKAVLAARHGIVPPIPHFERLNAHIDLAGSPVFISAAGVPWPVPQVDRAQPRRAGVSSFGFGGANAHVVIECPPDTHEPSQAAKGPAAVEVIVVSARDPVALRVYAQAYADFFSRRIDEGAGDALLADVGFTSRTGRPVFEHRLACVVDTLDKARELFHAAAGDAKPVGVRSAVHGADRLEETARAWTAGAAVDWEASGEPTARDSVRTAIPTYPFARTRFWPSWFNQPAAGEATETAGRRELSLAPFARLIAAHRIGARAMVPGAVFVRLLWDLARSLLGEESLSLERIRFLGNLESAQVPETLSATWERHQDVCRLTIRARPDGPVLCRAVVRVASGDGGVIALPVPPTEAWADGAAVYDTLRRHQVSLGPALHTIRRASWTHDRCIAALTVENSAPSLDPALLDGAFQAALLWQLATDRPAGLPIPISIDAVTVYRTLPPHCAVVVSAANGGRRGAMPRVTALVVADGEGRVCLRMDGFAAVARRVDSAPVSLFARTLAEVHPALLAGPEPDDRRSVPALVVGCGALAGKLADAGAAIVLDGPNGNAADGVNLERLLDRCERERGASASTVVLETGRRDWSADLEQMSRLGRALARRRARGPVRALALRLLGLQGDDEVEKDDRAIGAALGAFARSLRLEDPGVLASAVGLRAGPDAGWSHPAVVDTVMRLIRSGATPPEAEVDCVTGRVFAPSRRWIEAAEPVAQTPFRQGGVYLLTGGLGGLGRLIAGDLAGRFSAHLMLCGRSPIDAVAERHLAALRSLGGEIAYQSANVIRRPEVRKLVAETRCRFGRIDGVFHCAGVLRDGLLAYSEPGDLVDVARPKLLGARYLDLETRDDDLDLFVLFSSLVAATGNAGQCGYAFANGWLEGFAQTREARQRRGARRGRTVAIGWGPWRSDGMSLPARLQKRLAARHGLVPFEPSAGLAALERALAANEPTLLAVAGNPADLAEWIRRRSHSLDPGPAAARNAKTEAQTMYSKALENRAKALLVDAIVQESQLSSDQIDTAARFDEYGIDSVIIMAVTERLEDALGALPKTLFFEHRTVAELATHLAQAYAVPLGAIAGAPSEVDRIPVRGGRPAEVPAGSALLGASRQDDDIAIIGMDGRFPDADDAEEFWRNLAAGRDSISEVPPDRWDHRLVVAPEDASVGPESGFRWGGFIPDAFAFDPGFFQMSKREADMIDPQERLFLTSAYHCLEDAGYPGAALSGTEVGVFVGVMWGQYEMWGLERGDAASSYGSIANRVSYFFDFRGPSFAVDSMCSSSLMAIHLACASIRSGESKAAIAGGVNVNSHPNKHLFLCRRRFAAKDGRCRSFGAGGDGYVAGEGVGTVLLKLRSAAERDGDRILGLVRATATNHDGRTNGYTVPNPRAQTEVVRAALVQAGIEPRTVSYVEAHGTGTALGDPLEVSALTAAFRPWGAEDEYCALGSVKSNIGHTESAAGIAGVIKVLLQMRHHRLAPSIHADPPNPNIAFEDTPFRVQRELAPWPAEKGGPRRAGVSSFGAGGANAHVVLEEWTSSPTIQDGSRADSQLVPLSARTEDRLLDYVRRVLAALEMAGGKRSGQETSPRRETAPVAGTGDSLATLLDLVSETLELDRRFLRDDDRFSEYGLSESTAAGLAARIAGALGVSIEEVHLLDHDGPAELARWLDGLKGSADVRSALDLADVAYTLQTGREPMAVRLALIARSTGELIELLHQVLQGEEDGRIWRGRAGARAGGRAGSEAERTFLGNLARSRRLDKLAPLWCDGADVDWSILHPRGARRRLPLPGYPFAREVCRVAEPTMLVRGKAGVLHPLIDSVDLGRSLAKGLIFRKTLSGRAPILRDCLVAGRPALAPALALATADAARSLAGLSNTHFLTNVRWTAARPLATDLEDMLIRLIPAEEGRFAIEVGFAADPAGPFLTAALEVSATESMVEPLWQEAAQGPSASVCAFDLADRPASEVGENGLGPELLERALRAAASTQGASSGPVAAATLDRLLVPGSVPDRGRIVTNRAHGAIHAAVLGEDGTVRAMLSGLRFEEDRHSTGPLDLPREVVWVDVTDALGRDEAPASAPAGGGTRVVVFSPAERSLRDALIRQLGADSIHEIALDGTLDADGLALAIRRIPDVAEIFLLVGGGRPVLEPHTFPAAAANAITPLLGLAKSLDSTTSERRSPALRVITLAAHRIGDEAVNPISTAAAALVSALARETRRAEVSCLDLAPSLNGRTLDNAVQQALPVLRCPRPQNAVLSLRERRVFRQALRPLPPAPASAAETLERGERCLIVGGSGAVGQRLSASLAQRYGANIVWLGRRKADATIEQAARGIEALGGTLTYVSADVTDLDEMSEALEEIWRRIGPVSTVFHCGMEFTIARLASVDQATFDASIGAKTVGSLTLLKAFTSYPVKRVVLMSSGEAFVGNVGWGAYSCACAFQDGLAHATNGAVGGRVLSVNWGYWDGAERGNPATLVARGVRTITADNALSALERIFASGLRQVAVLDIEPSVLARMGLLDEPATGHATAAAAPDSQPPRPAAADGESLSREDPSRASQNATEVAPSPPSATHGRPLVRQGAGADAPTEARLRELMGRVLRIRPDELDPEADLVQYGADSILMLDFLALVEETLGRMPLEELIEQQSLRAMAAYIDSRAKPEPLTAETPPDGGGAELPPGLELVEAAPAEEVDAVLREYPRRLDLGEAALRRPAQSGNGHGSLRFWMVGSAPETAVEVVSCGEGPPVLFIPGIGLTAPVFHEQFRCMREDWSLFAIHAPGHGRSKPPKSATTAALSDTIAETLHLLGLRRPIHVVASCFATVAAQHLAVHRRDLVASLTLCGAISEDLAVPPIPPEGLSAKDVAALAEVASQSLAADFDALLEMPENAGRRAVIEEARNLLLTSQRASPAVGMRYLNEVLTLRPSEWVPAIVAPTLFIVGTCDTVVASETSRKAAERMQDARVLEIAGAGHYPFLTHSAVFNSGLIDFLRSVEA